jgi:hypothetical protein
MEDEELNAALDEYRDSNSKRQLIEFLKDRFVEELESMPADSEKRKHDLNMIIRDLEEEVHWVESEKLSGFDPESE